MTDLKTAKKETIQHLRILFKSLCFRNKCDIEIECTTHWDDKESICFDHTPTSREGETPSPVGERSEPVADPRR